MIISISWKNVWRNRSRSLIVVGAVTLGTVAGVFVAGLMKGMVDQKINSSIYTENGHIKIQNPNYLINEEVSYSIQNIDKLTNYLDNSSAVVAYSLRSKVMAMASTARGSAGISLKGINPEKDKQVSDVYKSILPNSGSYFESRSKLPPVFISRKTAELLKIKNFRITTLVIDSLKIQDVSADAIVKLDSIKNRRFLTDKKFKKAIKQVWTDDEIKDYGHALMSSATYYQPRAKITFTFTKTNGELGYQTYQVCGVFKTSNTQFDMMSAFVRNTDLAPATGLMVNQFHEASIILNNDGEDIKDFKEQISSNFTNESVMTWKELDPATGMMADFMNIYYYMIMGIIFFALAFGIINTMLMAILERIRELGMLMAIGMKKSKVFSMIMLETIFLTLTGSTIGMVLGWLLIKITGNTGINFSSVAEGFEAMGYAAIIYPDIEVSFFFGIIVMVIVVAILSSIIPARKALKLKPVEALRVG